MQTEIEAKFLNLSHDEMRERLRALGAKLEQPNRKMRRVVLDYADRRLQQKNGWVRVRDEGNRITCTYKEANEHEFGGAKELEVTLNNYQTAVNIFLAIGMEIQSEQESFRETWDLNGTEIVLDEWPWLNPFIEIEGKTEEAVQSTAEKLGLKWDEAVFGTVITVYRSQYPRTPSDEAVSTIKSFSFEEPVPRILTDGSE